MIKQEPPYVHEDSVHNTRAAKAFLPYLFNFITPKSVLDVGCGTGTWLAALKDAGVERILGIDGEYLDKTKLHITATEFMAADLREEISLEERFDLVLSLEVAEHLPASSADAFINTLTQHADVILFSAALEGQGGQNHANEQPFAYWVSKFNKKGYIVLDVFRQQIWDNKCIDWWYRQNIFLVVREGHEFSTSILQNQIYDFYHPELYLEVTRDRDNTKVMYNELLIAYNQSTDNFVNLMSGRVGVRISFAILVKSIKKFFKKLIELTIRRYFCPC